MVKGMDEDFRIQTMSGKKLKTLRADFPLIVFHYQTARELGGSDEIDSSVMLRSFNAQVQLVWMNGAVHFGTIPTVSNATLLARG
jgi:hypothetical protein